MPAYGLGTYGLGSYGIGQGAGPAPPITGDSVFPDVLPDFRAWLKAHPMLSPVIGGRVFYQVPTSDGKLAVSGYPFLRIYSVLEQPDNTGDIMWLVETVSIEAWGRKGDWPMLRNLKTIITTALYELGLQGSTRINPTGSTVTLDAAIDHWLDDVDPETGFARIIGNARLEVVGVSS
jgi:hypothetical protein